MTYLLSYFMGYIALVRCVLVLGCGLAGVEWSGIRMQDSIHPSSGPCDLFVELFHALYCSGTMCVAVRVWFGWGGVEWYPDAGFNTSILRSLRLIC